MKRLFAMCLLALVPSLHAKADIITQWNFNSNPSDANTSTGTLTPNLGVGTASLVGGTTATFASGDASGGSTDPNVGDDSGWNTTNYPALGVGNKTAGVQFTVSTTGFQNILLTFDQRHSNSVANTWRVQYSLDGTTFIDSTQFFVPTSATSGDTWYNNRSVDFTSISGLNNNPNAAFRVVSEFDPNTGNYQATETTYATSGTARFDMVTISGTAIPEPSSLLMLGMLGLAANFRRRSSVR